MLLMETRNNPILAFPLEDKRGRNRDISANTPNIESE
jgi:hypothetical protein